MYSHCLLSPKTFFIKKQAAYEIKQHKTKSDCKLKFWKKKKKVISNPALAGYSQIIQVENCPNFSTRTAFVSAFKLKVPFLIFLPFSKASIFRKYGAQVL